MRRRTNTSVGGLRKVRCSEGGNYIHTETKTLTHSTREVSWSCKKKKATHHTVTCIHIHTSYRNSNEDMYKHPESWVERYDTLWILHGQKTVRNDKDDISHRINGRCDAYLMRLETRLQWIISNEDMLVSVSTRMEQIAWKTRKTNCSALRTGEMSWLKQTRSTQIGCVLTLNMSRFSHFKAPN